MEELPPDYHIEENSSLDSSEDLYTVEDESIEENNNNEKDKENKSNKDEVKESGNKLIEKIKDKLRNKQ